MSAVVRRHFATLGHRQVHYRRAGNGPPVVLLHQSPTSSAELVPLMRHLAARYTVLAPDMPGYGASDPSDELAMSIAGLTANVIAWLDVLRIESAVFYGFHTGASVAASLARHHPGRVRAVICEGLLCLDDSARSDLLRRYVEPFEPRWDGGHLTWLWSRLKDQSLFFPWYQHTASARLELDGASVERLAASARDWLRCGERYRNAYVAAIRHDPLADLAAIRRPCYLIGRHADPLYAQLQRVATLPAGIERHGFDDAAAGLDCVLGLVDRQLHGDGCPPVVAAQPIDGGVWQHYVQTNGLQLRVLRAGAPGAPCVYLQHGAQRSVRACKDLLAHLGHQQHALALELPGHGESDAVDAPEALSIEGLAPLLDAALACLNVEIRDRIGAGAGAALQVELARQAGAARGSLTLIDPLDLSEHEPLRRALIDSYTPLPADGYGGYLLRAWHQARDHLLFFPWFDRRRECGVLDVPLLDAALIHTRSVELILSGGCGVALRRAELRYPLRERLGGFAAATRITGATRIAAARWEPRFAHSRRIAGSTLPFLELARERQQWGAQLAVGLDTTRARSAHGG
jgi:pimeloyl-ACP methyl ester carboxylesterase